MESKYFDVEMLAKGVYAAIGRTDTTAYSNCGILNLGDRTLVIDTFMMPKPGFNLGQVAEELTGRQAEAVILTHYHQDHWGGASSLPNAVFVSSVNARDIMVEDAPEYEEWKDDTSELEAGIDTTRSTLQGELEPRQRAMLEARLRRDEGMLEELPTLVCRIPDVTIDSRMTVYGSERKAELRVIELAHTESDLYVELPDDGIVFCGDLLFTETQPYMGDSSPEPWIAWLKHMETSEYDVFVPGHGPVVDTGKLALMREYIETLNGLIQTIVKRGGSVEEALNIKLPEPFAQWQAVEAGRFEVNVRRIHGLLAGQE